MIVANYVSNRPTMGETATYEDFVKTVGSKQYMLGIVARMNTDLTADFLTRSLANIYQNDEKRANKFQSIDSMYWEWENSSIAHYKLRELLEVLLPFTTIRDNQQPSLEFIIL